MEDNKYHNIPSTRLKFQIKSFTFFWFLAMDILTNFTGKEIRRQDFSNDWNKVPRLGKAKINDDFILSGNLGGTDRRGNWDSSDRVTFILLQPLTLTLNLDSNTITEVVKFDLAGNTSVVGSIEYADRLQLQLTPGRYGLSLFVEGDLVNYAINGKFTA